MWYVYILRCSDGSLYTGYTNDLSKRVNVHNAGKGSKYTRSRLPVMLAYSQNCNSKSDALKRELEIKGLGKLAKEKLCKVNEVVYVDA